MRRIDLGLFLLSMLLMAAPADAGRNEFNRTLSVVGQGKATTPPDTAVISTGVVSESVTAQEALSANTEAVKKIMDTLHTYKIAAKDIQTSSFTVSPEYKRDERGRRQTDIVGYSVRNQLRVKVRNLAVLGEVLDAVIRSGSNQVSGVDFGIDDPTDVLNLARKRAIADARNRAELYAQAAGVRIGKVLMISEQPVELLQPRAFRRNVAAEAVSAVPVEVGEQAFQVQIHITFSIEDKQ